MASFNPQKINFSNINSGVRYQNGDIVDAEAINAPIEASAWAQQVAADAKLLAETASGIETEAFYEAIRSIAAPLHKVIIFNDETDPAEIFGGYWLRIKDAFLWASGDIKLHQYSKDGVFTEEYLSVGGRGGEFVHTLTEAELVTHSHGVKEIDIAYPFAREVGGNTKAIVLAEQTGDYATITVPSHNTESTGSGHPHNNMPPYYAVNAWMRVTEEEFNANESL